MAATLNSCRACQHRVLNSFVSAFGLSLAPPRAAQGIHQRAHQLKASRTLSTPISRTFHTFPRQLEEQRSNAQEPPTSTIEQAPDTLSSEQQSDSTTDASIPWYLRVSTPTPLNPQNLPNPALQDLPPLPLDSPQILHPILVHLSISIGLDALTILDLRGLTPPSALGANLIMVLGTARSEKHLNTSADRFCRWTRGTYKLRPYADGLIGRNELKLKLRRRNKKLKLAQSVGNTMFDPERGYDDGITTGWICCNLGSVDSAVIPETEGRVNTQTAEVDEDDGISAQSSTGNHQVFSAKDQERPLEDEDEYKNPNDDDFAYRGFGSSLTAPKIVVQMFTEEKRAEMDLEGLWEARIKRRDDKEEKQDRLFETSILEKEIATPGVSRIEKEHEVEREATKKGRKDPNEFKPIHRPRS